MRYDKHVASRIDDPTDEASGRAEQWSSFTRFLRTACVNGRSFADFARSVEIDWVTIRLNEPLDLYIDASWESIRKTRGFGVRKLDQLFQSLQAIATHLGWRFEPEPKIPVAPKPVEPPTVVMDRLGLPRDYPISAGFFTERVLEFCANATLRTVVELARFTDSPGWRRTASGYRNFGKTSVAEVEDFSDALRRFDERRLQDFLPIRSDGGGLDLGLVAIRVARKQPTVRLEGLSNRLVHGRTLEEVAKANEKALTRERVRQIETVLLGSVQRALDAVAPVRAALWNEWSDTGEIASVDTEQGEDAGRLAAAAVMRLFSISEEGKALLAEREARCQAIFRSLCEEPRFYLGTLALDEFLRACPAAVGLRHLLSWNRRMRAFSFNAESGIAKSLSLRPKRIVAMLINRGMTDPMEILDFLNEAKTSAAWSIMNLERSYLFWRQSAEFPAIDLSFPTNTETVSGVWKSRLIYWQSERLNNVRS